MANLDQVISHIRFGLEQLSARNAHHDFEHLCRHLTRSRICSNILPSTGPVSAGGDQGRDFETFRTYLSTTPISDSTFVGLVSGRPIAFACTLEKRITTKIKADVKTIVSSGSRVSAIHYFSAADVRTADRHKLVEWTRKTHSVELEIHDGQSISEMLSDRGVFWIAERYLRISSEIYPRSRDDNGEGWYKKFLERCKESTPPLSHANFSDIKLAARNALSERDIRQDLPFWIELLKPYREADLPGFLDRRAVYELAVLSLRGLGSLEGQEDDIREYFATIPQFDESAEIEDAAALMNFCVYASVEHRCNLTLDELREWWTKLTCRVDDLLTKATSTNRQAYLLHERGYLCLWALASPTSKRQLDECIKWWMKLLKVVEDAPLFPLEDFADRLTKFIHFFSGIPAYTKLTQKVDALLSKRFGAFSAAGKCRDRAIALHDAGRMLATINQLHQSKINWFAAETMEYSLLSMLLIAQCYQRLGLVFAAKYYALAVATIALNSADTDVKRFVPRALEAAAGYDYQSGTWCGFLEMTGMALLNHQFFAEAADDISSHSYIQRLFFCILNVKAIAERFMPEVVPLVDSSIDKWKLTSLMEELLPLRRETWQSSSDSEFLSKIESELNGPPFSDLGVKRSVVWSELGITWRIEWQNDYQTVPTAEAFVAFLQIFLAEIAHLDLCLLKSKISIDLSLSDDTKIEFKASTTEEGRIWKIAIADLSKSNDPNQQADSQRAFMLIALSLLADLSLLPDERFQQITKDVLRGGVSSRLFVAQPYEVLYRLFVQERTFEGRVRISHSAPKLSDFDAKEYVELGWRSSPGPGYSARNVKRWTKNRYNLLRPPIALTLERLKHDRSFSTVLTSLRREGWLDWHLLSAINGITLNYRTLLHPNARGNPDVMQSVFSALMRRPENDTDPPVPLSYFTDAVVACSMGASNF